MNMETRLAQIGTKKDRTTGAINFPVYYATAYEHINGESTGYDYTRTANPTREVLEQAMADLEKGERGFACSSGMAAILTVMGLFEAGDHLIVSLDLYGGTYRLFEKIGRRYGLTFTYLDLRNQTQIKQALQPNTRAIFLETPTNPLMQIIDIEKIAHFAQSHQLLTIVDNTFLTPYYQQPLTLGADIVVHSATKYLGGHNDVLAGLIVCKEVEISEKIAELHNGLGGTLGPHDSYLLMRGMKTLALRMERHQQNAQQIRAFLIDHPMVTDVFYPDFSLVPNQSTGCGGMISFRLVEARLVHPFLQQLRCISYAESLGGVESLITYPATQTHSDIPETVRLQVGVCDRLLRLSVGIEGIDDLRNDLEQAFTFLERNDCDEI